MSSEGSGMVTVFQSQGLGGLVGIKKGRPRFCPGPKGFPSISPPGNEQTEMEPEVLGPFLREHRDGIPEAVQGYASVRNKPPWNTSSHVLASDLPPIHAAAETDQLSERCQQQATSERETRKH